MTNYELNYSKIRKIGSPNVDICKSTTRQSLYNFVEFLYTTWLIIENYVANRLANRFQICTSIIMESLSRLKSFSYLVLCQCVKLCKVRNYTSITPTSDNVLEL